MHACMHAKLAWPLPTPGVCTQLLDPAPLGPLCQHNPNPPFCPQLEARLAAVEGEVTQLRARLADADKQLAEARAQLAREQQGGAQQAARVATLEQQLLQLQQAKVTSRGLGAGLGGEGGAHAPCRPACFLQHADMTACVRLPATPAIREREVSSCSMLACWLSVGLARLGACGSTALGLNRAPLQPLW